MQDHDIVALYVARDERAIAETTEKYGRLCKKIAMRITGDEHDAEECVNDALLGAWRAIPPQRPHSLSAFVAKITRNLAISRLKYRRASKRNESVLVSLSELESVIPDKSFLDELEDRELGRLISDFLYGEQEEARNIFIRKYWFFDSVAELSMRYGYTEAKIKSILFRTRQRLRAYLEEKGITV